jgi:hypothetical protein
VEVLVGALAAAQVLAAARVLMASQMLDRWALKRAQVAIKRAPGKLAGEKGPEVARRQAHGRRVRVGRMMGWRARRLRLAAPAWVERLALAVVRAARARVERPRLAVVPVVRVLAQRLPRPERLLQAVAVRGITTNSTTITGIVIKARLVPRLRMPTRRVVKERRPPRVAVRPGAAPEAGTVLARATALAAGRVVHTLLPGSGCCAQGN